MVKLRLVKWNNVRCWSLSSTAGEESVSSPLSSAPHLGLLLGPSFDLKFAKRKSNLARRHGAVKSARKSCDGSSDVVFGTTALQFKMTLGLTRQHEGCFGFDLLRRNWCTMLPVKYYQRTEQDDKLELSERASGSRMLLDEKQWAKTWNFKHRFSNNWLLQRKGDAELLKFA